MNTTTILLLGTMLPGLTFAAYEPLKSTGDVKVVDTEFQYGGSKRAVPLRIYLPDSRQAAPVILFSHGLGGSRKNNGYLGKHWAGRGYVVVSMQHAGSDETVWRDAPIRQRMSALTKAAGAKSFLDRVKDVSATLDQLAKWNSASERFAGRFDLTRVGMSGHSFGAVTTQAVSGQSYGRRGQVHSVKRIKAAIAFSPSPPQFGASPENFAKVKLPWLLMTGTKDKSAIGRTTAEKRRLVFEQLPSRGHAFELVLDNAEHMAFSDRTLLGRQHRNPNHHKSIQSISTAFWDCYLLGDGEARAWLSGPQVKRQLDEKDIWLSK